MAQPYSCKGCGQPITFDNSIKSESGKVIPLNAADKSRHDCPTRQKPAATSPSSSNTATPTAAEARPPAAPEASRPAPTGLVMSLTEFDLQVAGVARQIATYLTSLAPYSRFTIAVDQKETRK